jgi:hypothetical protein
VSESRRWFDASDSSIPNIRRDNFAVYENGGRQQIETVEIEHPPVSLGLLMEFGGRAPAFDRLLGEQVASAGPSTFTGTGS